MKMADKMARDVLTRSENNFVLQQMLVGEQYNFGFY